MKKLEAKSIKYKTKCYYWISSDCIYDFHHPPGDVVSILIYHNNIHLLNNFKLYDDISKIDTEIYHHNDDNTVYYRVNKQSDHYVSQKDIEKLLVISRYIKIKKIKKILYDKES